MRIIDEVIKKYGTCHYTVAKETFMYTPATIGLPRQSTFTDEIRIMCVKFQFK